MPTSKQPSQHHRGIAVVLIGVPAPGLTLAPWPLYENLPAKFGLPVEAGNSRRILAGRGRPRLVAYQ